MIGQSPHSRTRFFGAHGTGINGRTTQSTLSSLRRQTTAATQPSSQLKGFRRCLFLCRRKVQALPVWLLATHVRRILHALDKNFLCRAPPIKFAVPFSFIQIFPSFLHNATPFIDAEGVQLASITSLVGCEYGQ